MLHFGLHNPDGVPEDDRRFFFSRRSMLPVVNYYLTPACVEWPAVVCPAPTAG